MDKVKERFKKLMRSLALEYIGEEADNMTLADMVNECTYWLDCYYEEGNSLLELKYEDPKHWKSDTDKLKRFINRYKGA